MDKTKIYLILLFMGAILGSCNNDPQVYNEPFLENTAYDSEEESEPGASGDVLSIKQEEAKVQHVVEVENTSAGNMHPAHVQLNAALGGGDVKVPLEPLGSSTGLNTTSFLSLEESKPIIFENIATLDAYINVHLSGTEMSTIIAEGNIGANDGSTEGNTTNFDVSSGGASADVFNDGGFTNANNPNLTLKRGETYTFTVNSPGHPFYINSSQGTGTSNAYVNGVTNNGATDGTITFTVPDNAPDTLYYNCEFHSAMTGTITITD